MLEHQSCTVVQTVSREMRSSAWDDSHRKSFRRHSKGLIVVLEVEALGKSRPRDFFPRDGGRLSGSSSEFRPVKSQPAQAFSRSSPCWGLSVRRPGWGRIRFSGEQGPGVVYSGRTVSTLDPRSREDQSPACELQKPAPTDEAKGGTYLPQNPRARRERDFSSALEATPCLSSLSCEKALAALPCSERDTPRRAAVWVLCAWAAQLGLAAFAGLITHLP